MEYGLMDWISWDDQLWLISRTNENDENDELKVCSS